MADTDVLIKDLPLTETVNDSDDLVTEDSSPTTHRIKASVVKNYINAEQNEELDGLKVDLDNVNSNIGSLSSKVDDATTTVSSMQTNLNSMDGRVQANADGISELNSALAYLGTAYTTGTVSVSSQYGTTFTICSLKVPMGHKYLVLGHNVCDASTSSSNMNVILVASGSGATLYNNNKNCRTMMQSGGGVSSAMFIDGSSATEDITINLNAYGYYNGTYNQSGTITAIIIG